MGVKRIAAFNDLSGWGRCSLTVALPVLSAMGHQCCPAPTSVLSCHTGFPSYHFTDMTPQLPAYLKNWEENGFTFDGIYTGFLGSYEQITILSDFLRTLPNHPYILVDPVMGDGGQIYGTYTPRMCEAMRELVRHADLVTPNLTEAALLAGVDYPGEEAGPEKALELARAVTRLGATCAVVTGLRSRGADGAPCISAVAYNSAEGAQGQGAVVTQPLQAVGEVCSGTGDLFASAVLGGVLRSQPLYDAIGLAMRFIARSVAYTKKCGADFRNGIVFEPLLGMLVPEPGEGKGMRNK